MNNTMQSSAINPGIPASLYRATILLVALLGLNGCAAIKDWTTSDNATPPTPLANFTPSASFSSAWQAQVGDGSGGKYLKMGPLVTANRVVAAAADGTVSAFERRSGSRQWSIDTDTKLSSSPGGNDEMVVVGSSDGEVIALSGASGAELWRSPLNSEILSAPGIADNTVIVRTSDGHVYGLKRSDGEQIWAYNQTEPVLTLRGTSAPQVFSNGVIIGMDNGNLVTLLSDTGQRIWDVAIADARGRSELERIVDIDGDPVLFGDAVFAVSYQGNVGAVGLRSGNPLWRREMSSSAGLAVDNNNVYVTDSDSNVWAVSNSGGSSVWKQEGLAARSLTAPAAVGSGVVVGDLEGYLHLLAADDGRFLARTQVGSSAIHAPPVFADGILYVSNAKGQLRAMSISGSAAP